MPAFLLGNFTWDWILEEYLAEEPGFADGDRGRCAALQSQAAAYLRLPMSVPSGRFAREEEIPLVARRPRRSRAAVRAELGASDEDKLILLSFGGFGIKRAAARPPGRSPAPARAPGPRPLAAARSPLGWPAATCTTPT